MNNVLSLLKKKGIINSGNSYLKISLTILFAYICIYLIFIRPIYKLHELQTKEWMYDLTKIMICGLNNRDLYNDIRVDGRNISFWYAYWFVNTKKYTIFVLFHLNNKNSKDALINVYSVNHNTRRVTNDKLVVTFDNIRTRNTDNDEIIIEVDNKFVQTIDFKNDTIRLILNINDTKLEVYTSTEDYITNQGSFIPRYRMLDYITDMNAHMTHTPGEWGSVNPIKGNVKGGSFNGDIIEPNGSFWCENFIGCNNYYLEPYAWFIVMNEDWLLYFIWLSEYDMRNDPCTVKGIFIKDRKNNKYIYAGLPGAECFKSVPIFKDVNIMLSPIKTTYDTTCNFGDEMYDKHKLVFESNEINIKISAIEGSFVRAIDYYYYRSETTSPAEGYPKPSSPTWEDDYQRTLNNLKFAEYVGEVDVEIVYNGVTTNFKERQIIETMYREDKTIPHIITFK
jgi:hypothetical protein